MYFWKFLSIFCLLNTCKAPIHACFDGSSGRRGETEFSVEEWQGFVENPIEGRARLREVCGELAISSYLPCLEFRFKTRIDPQPAEDGETVVINVVESAHLKIRRIALSDRPNLEIDMKIPGAAGIVFYLQGNDEFQAKCGLGNCCATYFQDCLHDVRAEDLQLKRLLFYKGDDKIGGYLEDEQSFDNYGISGHFTLKVFNFFQDNSKILIEKVFQVLSRYEEMPYDFKAIIFNATWYKILKVRYDMLIQYLDKLIIATRDVGGLPTFIHHASEALNTLNLVPNHPKLYFPEDTTEQEFAELFRAWYEYGME